MNRLRLAGAFAPLLLLATIASATTAAAPTPRIQAGEAHGLVGPHKPVGEVQGAWWHGARGNAGGRPSRSPNMTYHGGVVMPSSTVSAIFWGPSWANSSFVGDKITGLDTFYAGWGGSSFAKTNTEYGDGINQVGTASTYSGHIIDTSTASGGGSTSAILAEVARQVAAGRITLRADGTTYVPVYTDLPRGNAGYCAWHSAGTINGTRVEFGFFWKLDGDGGCDPVDSTTGHSQGLAALANVSAHELSEAVTDPASPGAWYDQQGAENADKCAWAFNVPSVTLSNGSKWKLQGNWSNAAYTAGTGYTNRGGQKGCLDGH